MSILKELSLNFKQNVLGNSDKTIPIICNGITMQQFGVFPINESIELFLSYERKVLVFTSKKTKDSVELPFERLLYYSNYCNTDIVTEQKKHVVGRTIIGNILFGPIGALIGGLTAKDKKKSYCKWYFKLGYMDVYGNQKELVFEDLNGTNIHSGKTPQISNKMFESHVNNIYNQWHGTKQI